MAGLLSQAARPQKFGFETEFDAVGQVAYIATRPKRSYSPEEVEAVRRAALDEGERMALESLARRQAEALEQIADACRRALPRLAEVAHANRAGAAGLAMACARGVADAALDAFPAAPIQAAVEALSRELDAQPRLVAVVPEGLAEDLRPALEEAVLAAGFAGALVLREDAAMADGAFTLDFGDGRAAFDPDEAARRVTEALEQTLAADALHAEPLLPPSTLPPSTPPLSTLGEEG